MEPCHVQHNNWSIHGSVCSNDVKYLASRLTNLHDRLASRIYESLRHRRFDDSLLLDNILRAVVGDL